MNIENITNVEILYNTNLKNKGLVKIPKTNYHLIYSKTRTGLWNLHMIEMMGCKRKALIRQIEEGKLAEIINYILRNADKVYKYVEDINKFTEEFKQILINTNNKNERNNKNSSRRSRISKLQRSSQ